jgi:hypothetical protein
MVSDFRVHIPSTDEGRMMQKATSVLKRKSIKKLKIVLS